MSNVATPFCSGLVKALMTEAQKPDELKLEHCKFSDLLEVKRGAKGKEILATKGQKNRSKGRQPMTHDLLIRRNHKECETG